MKFLIPVFLMVMSFPLFAADGEIKTKDMKNNEINSMTSSDQGESITPEQMDKLKSDVETIKENEKKSDEMLKELDKDL